MVCTIYVIKNKVNNKVYIGQTWSFPNKRFQNHLRDRKGECPKLFNALNKYGRSVFYIEPLAFCENQIDADKSESLLIQLFSSIRNGYNTKEGGRGGKHSYLSKQKMSKARLGKRKTNEHKRNIGLSNTGKLRSEETKRKLSLVNSGKSLSKEHKKKIAKTLLGNQRRKGKSNSTEVKRKISLGLIGNKNRLGISHTDETKRLLSFLSSGEKNKNAKLTLESVNQVRKDYLVIKSQRKLAIKYGVCKTTIARILSGESW